MGESVDRIAITVGEKVDREGQKDKNRPDSVIVHISSPQTVAMFDPSNGHALFPLP